jgi:micrococcal nuclease
VRIAGIDCPESRNTKKLRDQAKTYSIKPEVLLKIGKAAKNLGKQKVLNQQVVIAFPHGKIERDAFGRLLAYVEIDGADYGGFLIENGFAYPRPEEHPLIKKYRKLNSKAQKNESGLYGWQE